jgi:hypothetical protein
MGTSADRVKTECRYLLNGGGGAACKSIQVTAAHPSPLVVGPNQFGCQHARNFNDSHPVSMTPTQFATTLVDPSWLWPFL